MSAANSTPDLFGDLPDRYPLAPGSKGDKTSREAARRISLRSSAVRAEALSEFRAIHPNGLTADQVAKLIGKSLLYVRPRVSELRADGLIEPTPETRPNAETGMSARVWRATSKAMAQCQ